MKRLPLPAGPETRTLTAPGYVVVRLALGEAPGAIPPAEEVRRARAAASTGFGVAPVDRVLRHFSDEVRIARVHRPAQAHGFDDIETASGLAQSFSVRVDPSCPVADLVDALRCVSVVHSASPRYLATLPLSAPAAVEDQAGAGSALPPSMASPDKLEGWYDRDSVRGPEALAYEPGDDAVVVAVVDTGIDRAHEAFAGAVRAGLDTVRLVDGDLAPGMQLIGDTARIDTDPTDDVGHGTETSAIIAARAGILPPGLASGCGLLPMRALGAARMPGRASVVGVGALIDIDVAIKYAVDLDAKVINLSLGTPVHDLDTGSDLPHTEAVRYALAHNCIVVAAAGNSGQNEDYVPACLDGVIAVSAVDRSGRPAGFNTRSDSVAIAAPGERILTASMDGGYARVTGTSFAAPFVSGAIALMVSRANRRAQPIDAAMVRRLLRQSAQPWSDPVPHGSGAGTLDAFAALRALDAEIDARWPMNAP